MRWKVLFAVFFFVQIEFLAGEPVTFTAGVVAVGSAISAGFLAGFSTLNCLMNECCTDSWIPANYSGLAESLNSKLYGQHLVTDPVVKHLKAHGRGNPSKALVLSFHGGTGTGKNYVSRLVAEKLFYKGMKSKYVHLISATKEFPHDGMVPMYKDKLRDKIEKAVKECPRSFFIFDEMDKMPPGIIDTLKPYLDFYEKLDDVDYRRTTFFFLSNTGGTDIAERTMRAWSNNEERQSLKLKEMEQIIQTPALNTKNGMWHSELIMKNLITAYIPFLPLERSHIKQCIRDGLVERRYYLSAGSVPESRVQEIADELQYFPDGVLLFSSTGCKRIHEKIGFIMEEL
ncbi:chaperone cofactor-dependent protein refolding [Mactra antiquata]